MENKVQVQDHSQEILSVIRSNASPGILRNKLEDYHENDLADIFPELTYAGKPVKLEKEYPAQPITAVRSDIYGISD
mgnify:CR=1 FL=1